MTAPTWRSTIECSRHERRLREIQGKRRDLMADPPSDAGSFRIRYDALVKLEGLLAEKVADELERVPSS
ncbi:MAG: hypothetical protein H0W25_01175 [Acidimicrobiia bacterium]|nr:hypothetical protein [Acidimicrobiia bacterium]